MIKSFTAFTQEIDDVGSAVAEILEMLDINKNMMKNSVGIVSCFSEFEETGVLEAVCDALPFDCIGATTCLCSVNKKTEQIIFTITMLTSDDCSFETVAIPMIDDYEASVKATLAPLIEKSDNDKPSLILTYLPLLVPIGGDMMLQAIDKVTGGVPLFGTSAIDHTESHLLSKTLHNGVAYRESIVLGLIRGSLESSFLGTSNCTFEIATISQDKVRNQKAIITESSGNILIEVNNKPILEYLKEFGISQRELTLGLLPFIIDFKDGTRPLARSIIAVTPEGALICGGAMTVGATLSFGRVDSFDIPYTTEKVLKPLVEKDCLILSYSCMSRFLALGMDNTSEAEKVIELVGDGAYLYACSGGEICPQPDKRGNLKNCFHNYTNVFCKIS